jgi:hypothetical protein
MAAIEAPTPSGSGRVVAEVVYPPRSAGCREACRPSTRRHPSVSGRHPRTLNIGGHRTIQERVQHMPTCTGPLPMRLSAELAKRRKRRSAVRADHIAEDPERGLIDIVHPALLPRRQRR